MDKQIIGSIVGLIFCTFFSTKIFAQTASVAIPSVDDHTMAMQNLIVKLIVESGSNFKTIKGAEIARKPDGSIEYKAMIAYIAPGEEERGAMLTTDDEIIEVQGSSFYVAKYVDDEEAPFSLRDFAETAILKMNLWKGDSRMVFSTATVPSENQTELKSLALLLNGKQVAVFNNYIKAGKSALIIGLKN